MAACLWLATASLPLAPASAAVVPFDGSGAVTPGPGFNPLVSPWPLEVLPQLSNFVVGGAGGWTLASSFEAQVSFPNGVPLPGNGQGTFRLAGPNGDALSGRFESTFDFTNGPFGGYDLEWTVESGEGQFLNQAGTGTSVTVFTSDPLAGFPVSFTDTGRFVLQLVPEPAAAALAALALAASLAASRRRRPRH